MTETLNEESTSAASLVWAPRWEMLNDLTSVAACIDTTGYRPLLAGVHLYRDGADIVAEATDSFTLAIARVTVGGNWEGDVVIPAKWLRDFLKSTKPRAKQMRVDVLVSVKGDTISLKSGDKMAETRIIAGTYPSVSHLIPAESNRASELGAFNAEFLAKMANVLPQAKPYTTWVCKSMARDRVSLWEATKHGGSGEHAYSVRGQFLIMPVRIS